MTDVKNKTYLKKKNFSRLFTKINILNFSKRK